MKIDIHLSDVSPADATSILQILSSSVHRVTPDVPRKAVGEFSEPASNAASNVTDDTLTDLPDPEPTDALPEDPGTDKMREAEQFIATCDAKGWKRTASIQIEGTTKKVNDEVVLADTGEVVVLRVLYRGRAIVEAEDGTHTLVEAKQLGLTPEETSQAAETPPSPRPVNGNGAGQATAPAEADVLNEDEAEADDGEPPIDLDALRKLGQKVVDLKSGRYVLGLIEDFTDKKSTKLSDVPPGRRNELRDLFLQQLGN
jgi:hypothetical protein